MTAEPLNHTERDPSRRSDGEQVGAIARLLGTPLMPWQQRAADVALERLPDGTYAYPVVVVTVPRQSGKTLLLRTIAMQKMMAHRRREIYYTAQTGKDARARWQQLVEAIEADRTAGKHFTVRRSAGDPSITHRGTRSKFAPFAPTAESLHGYTPHDVMIDEAFSLNENDGRLLMGAIIPAQSTIRDRQLYIVSTRGTAESTFLDEWIERGRNGAPGVALIEYAARPGQDAYDPESWPQFHPAYGLTVFDDVLTQASRDLSRAEFERAYANRPTLTESHLIPLDAWEPHASDVKVGDGDAVALTYEVAHDGSAATVLVSWSERATRFDADLHHRIVCRAPGDDWLVDTVQQLARELRPDVIAADDGGAVRGHTAELRRRGLEVETTNAGELATAWARWQSRVRRGGVKHDGTPEFWTAVAGLVTRPMGDATAPSRRLSAGDISPAIAAMVAGLKLEQLAAPAPPPMTYVYGGDAA